MSFEADYYDGISPRAKKVWVTIAGAHLVGYLDKLSIDQAFDHLLQDCTVQTKLAHVKRLIDLPDDAHLETDASELESYFPAKKSIAFWRVVHYAESHLWLVALALGGAIVVSLAMLKYGVPVAAKYAALATPELIEKDLGKQTLELLDHEKLGYFQASKLTVDKQTRLQNALVAMCKKTQTCPAYDLNFRSSKVIGANAFALPGGYMVITDELIALADSDDEITAVLAHELGHVKLRHALRQTLQGTISGLIIVAITGDISSIAAGLPALMVNMSYNRELETEADTYALQSLNTACIAAKSFSIILSKLSQSHGHGMNIPEIISSHPDTKSRMIPFEKDQRSCT
jgi:Zn-dependent protease with chaperone function